MDEVFSNRFQFQEHTGVLTRVMDQPSKDLILERNARIRKEPEALRDLGKGTQTWARPVATIPFIIYEEAIRDGYELNSKDTEHRQKELFRFLKSDAGKMCLIREGVIL